ncbi:Peroxisomal biogenesis factor 3 [Frankliniella fusca]|uniref:Peroxisomal biogenesis factor 3 n=1 Tax=Frankliniella fusca TaxID=407009 RepID=A0AAE1I2I4_9NEOP|nr:Peroxisomal biogenesis factor 3 [Frankliniella fusca]
MFSRFKDFVSRHKRKFVVTGVVVGGAWLALKYAQQKLHEYTENEAKEFVERSRRQQHYKSTERTCDQTILSLSPAIHESIINAVNTEELAAELQTATSEKLAIWEKLKVKAFTRVAALVYANSILVLLLRIQLNLVGGFLVRDANGESGLPTELQHVYLSLCHHLRDSGVVDLCNLIERHVQPILENVSLKKPMSLRDTEELFWSIQNSIESNVYDNPIKTISKYVFPPKEKVDTENLQDQEVQQLFSIMSETVDLLDSDEVASITRSCVSQSFAAVVDKLAEHFAPICSLEPVAGPSNEQVANAWASAMNGATKDCSFINPNNVTIPLAKLIPIVSKLTELNHNKKDLWIYQLVRNDLVKVFGANVYEAFGQKE